MKQLLISALSLGICCFQDFWDELSRGKENRVVLYVVPLEWLAHPFKL